MAAASSLFSVTMATKPVNPGAAGRTGLRASCSVICAAAGNMQQLINATKSSLSPGAEQPTGSSPLNLSVSVTSDL